ncbi:hypothetical protein F4781DRAFT_436817 [Annulohypoxylon bovei var. microspora]|nr:hypothetical protein F4781DRAFT_436817 [Annulohypoxylon bovei var. microspora]
MCYMWPQKSMACGHIEADFVIHRCKNFSSASPESCLVQYQGANRIRPCMASDGPCYNCAQRQAMDNEWSRALGTAMNDQNVVALLNARAYILSLTFVAWKDVRTLHTHLTAQYIDDRSVMDLDVALGVLGYPTVANPTPQPRGL